MTLQSHGLVEVMNRTHHRIVNVPDPTPFAVRRLDLQATDRLTPEDRHSANICECTEYPSLWGLEEWRTGVTLEPNVL